MMIVLSGMIGAGKTTLASTLQEQHPDWVIVGESNGNSDTIPQDLLDEFYADPVGNAFKLQLTVLNGRFKDIKHARELEKLGKTVVLDRSIYEDSLFEEYNHKIGNINDEEHKVYQDLLANMQQDLKQLEINPDIYVFIKQPLDNILSNIWARGRESEYTLSMKQQQRYLVDFEPGIAPASSMEDPLFDYYKGLNESYDEWGKTLQYVHPESVITATVPLRNDSEGRDGHVDEKYIELVNEKVKNLNGQGSNQEIENMNGGYEQQAIKKYLENYLNQSELNGTNAGVEIEKDANEVTVTFESNNHWTIPVTLGLDDFEVRDSGVIDNSRHIDHVIKDILYEHANAEEEFEEFWSPEFGEQNHLTGSQFLELLKADQIMFEKFSELPLGGKLSEKWQKDMDDLAKKQKELLQEKPNQNVVKKDITADIHFDSDTIRALGQAELDKQTGAVSFQGKKVNKER